MEYKTLAWNNNALCFVTIRREMYYNVQFLMEIAQIDKVITMKNNTIHILMDGSHFKYIIHFKGGLIDYFKIKRHLIIICKLQTIKNYSIEI